MTEKKKQEQDTKKDTNKIKEETNGIDLTSYNFIETERGQKVVLPGDCKLFLGGTERELTDISLITKDGKNYILPDSDICLFKDVVLDITGGETQEDYKIDYTRNKVIFEKANAKRSVKITSGIGKKLIYTAFTQSIGLETETNFLELKFLGSDDVYNLVSNRDTNISIETLFDARVNVLKELEEDKEDILLDLFIGENVKAQFWTTIKSLSIESAVEDVVKVNMELHAKRV